MADVGDAEVRLNQIAIEVRTILHSLDPAERVQLIPTVQAAMFSGLCNDDYFYAYKLPLLAVVNDEHDDWVVVKTGITKTSLQDRVGGELSWYQKSNMAISCDLGTSSEDFEVVQHVRQHRVENDSVLVLGPIISSTDEATFMRRTGLHLGKAQAIGGEGLEALRSWKKRREDAGISTKKVVVSATSGGYGTAKEGWMSWMRLVSDEDGNHKLSGAIGTTSMGCSELVIMREEDFRSVQDRFFGGDHAFVADVLPPTYNPPVVVTEVVVSRTADPELPIRFSSPTYKKAADEGSVWPS